MFLCNTKQTKPVSYSYTFYIYKKKEISEKLNSLFESAQKQTAELDGDLHFLRFVDKSKRDSFQAMLGEFS